MTAVRTGSLNQRVTIQQPTDTADGAGGKTFGWADVVQTWAQVAPINGGEVYRAGVLRATEFYQVTLRYRSGITPRHRLLWNGQTLNIRTCADPDGKRDELLITAETGAAD